MVYEINPCFACWKKYKRGDCNINDLNNCLVDTASAFSKIPSTNYLRSTNDAENWNKCIVKKMAEIGRAPCNFQLNMAPVFVQTPHPFPSRLEELKDKDKALKQSLEDCKNSRYVNECKINCQTDYDAVVEIDGEIPETDPNLPAPLARGTFQCTKETYEEPYSTSTLSNFTFEDIADNKPATFWIFFIITSIILSFIIVVFLYILLSKNK